MNISAKYTICDDYTLAENAEKNILCAVQLETPENGSHVPTHYVFLVDTSGSMSEGGKLENVKRCLGSMMNYLQEGDNFSLITFESNSVIHIDHLLATPENKAYIMEIVRKVFVEDMTNLSAGLGNVRKVVTGTGRSEKTALFLLTDGHINQGVTADGQLLEILQNILHTHGNMNAYCIGYGADHNAELLRAISIDGQGSYNIVNSVEDVATAFGDTIGGLISIVAQNVTVTFPEEAVVLGAVKHKKIGGKMVIQVGDLYAGTQPIYLVEIPASVLARENGATITVSAMELPHLLESNTIVQGQIDTTANQTIQLTRLRYTCTELLNKIQRWGTLGLAEKDILRAKVAAFKTEITAEEFNGSILADQLREEIPIMERTMNGQWLDEGTRNIMSQHMAYFCLGRGMNSGYGAANVVPPLGIQIGFNASRSLSPMFGGRQNANNWVGLSQEPMEEDMDENPIAALPTPTTSMRMASAFQSPTQRTVSNNLREASSRT